MDKNRVKLIQRAVWVVFATFLIIGLSATFMPSLWFANAKILLLILDYFFWVLVIALITQFGLDFVFAKENGEDTDEPERKEGEKYKFTYWHAGLLILITPFLMIALSGVLGFGWGGVIGATIVAIWMSVIGLKKGEW